SDFLKEDYEDGVLEQMLIKFSNFEIFILAKIISNWLIFCLPILMMIFIFSLLFGIETHFVKKLFLLLSIASLAIIFITSFSGCLNLLSGKTSLIAIIV